MPPPRLTKMLSQASNTYSQADDLATERDVRWVAMDLLARREHGHTELLGKLLKRFSQQQDLVHACVASLVEEGLQSDLRYGEALLHSLINRLRGPLRVRQEMRHKGLADSLINALFEEAEIDWFLLARQSYFKKFADKPITDFKDRAKRMRYLQGQGFTGDHISAAIAAE